MFFLIHFTYLLRYVNEKPICFTFDACAKFSSLFVLGYFCSPKVASGFELRPIWFCRLYKSGLIEDIARVTNKSVCYFYEGSGNTVATDHGIAVSGDSNQINALSEKFIALLEKKDEQMDRLIGIIEKNNK